MADALPDDWSPPRRLDGYELLREIGRGGMGVVCLARQVALDRTVAVKVLHPRWARDAQLVARFTREAMAAARLTHPNIVQIHDIGMAAGQYYFSMEYVGGRTLADLLAREGRLAPREAAGYVLQAARGLACAHRNGIIHRDVKPGNLVLNDEGLCKVADLGLVKTSDPDPGGEAVPPGANPGLTRAGARMGTPLYMAPEQADPKARVDARTDIYALGCTLYHLLAGRPAHGGEDTTQILNRHRAGRPTPPRLLQPDVPEDLQRIVLGMIERDPAKRQASMEEVVRALEGFLRERAARGYEPSEAERRTVETAARDFRRSQWPTVEAWLGRILPGAAGTLTALALLLGDLYLAGIFLGLLALPPAALFLVRGLGSGTPAFSAFRQLLWTNRPADWGVIAVGVLLGLGLLGLVGLLGAWAGIALLSLLAALVYHLTIDAAIREEQAPVLDRVQAMLRRSRSRGAGEEDLRRFVWTHAGPGGEPFYEALFGYPALREARAVWGSGPRGGLPVQSRRLREAFVRWAERWTGERQAEALESHLRAVTDRAEPGPPDAAPPKPRMEPRGTDPHGADGADDGGIPPLAAQPTRAAAPPPGAPDPDWGPLPPAWRPPVAGAETAGTAGTARPATPPGKHIPSLSDPVAGGHAPRATVLSVQPSQKAFRRERKLFRRHGVLDILFGARIRFLLGVLLLFATGAWLVQNEIHRPLPDPEAGRPAAARTAPPRGAVLPGVGSGAASGAPDGADPAAADDAATGSDSATETGPAAVSPGPEEASGPEVSLPLRTGAEETEDSPAPAEADSTEADRKATGPVTEPPARAARPWRERVGRAGRDVLARLRAGTEPLRLPGPGRAVPERAMALLFNSFAPALAGLILILSAGYPGPKLGIGVLPGVLVIVLGPAILVPLGAEAVLPEPLRPAHVAMALGGVLAAAGWVWGKPEV